MDALSLVARARRSALALDWIVAVALTAAGVADVFVRAKSVDPHFRAPTWAIMLMSLVVFLSLGLRRRFGLEVLACVAVASLLLDLVMTDPHYQGSLELFLAWLVVAYSFAAHEDGRRYQQGAALALGAVVVFEAVTLSAGMQLGQAIPSVMLPALAWLVGRVVCGRQRLVVALGDRTQQLELEREGRERAAVANERARIARELHDIVAHSVSVMVIQAQAGQRLLGEPEQAGGAFRSIETTGHEALVDLRRMLGILRTGDQELAIGPQPGLAALPALGEQMRQAGLPVTVRVEGEQVALPAGIDLSAFRILQEALTNTLKHAGPVPVEVVVHYNTSALELEVLDDGHTTIVDRLNGSGHGLVGMRERVTLYGGTLESGRRDGGGFAVRVRLPLRGAGA